MADDLLRTPELENRTRLMSTATILRIVAISALLASLPVLFWANMPDIALALAACGAISGVMAMRISRRGD